MKRFKTIGVLGGIGPVATAHFYQTILDLAQKEYGCVQDNEYPQIIINSLAFEGSTENGIEDDQEIILNQLTTGVKSLEKAGAELIVIPCNSVHTVFDKLTAISKVPLLNIIEEVVKKIQSDSVKRVLILTSLSSNKRGLYHKECEKKGIKYFRISNKIKDLTTQLILDVMSGKKEGQSKKDLISELAKINDKKIEGIILGCTELPVAITTKDTNQHIYDSIEILARATLKKAYLLNEQEITFSQPLLNNYL